MNANLFSYFYFIRDCAQLLLSMKVEALGEIEVATKLLKDDIGTQVFFIYASIILTDFMWHSEYCFCRYLLRTCLQGVKDLPFYQMQNAYLYHLPLYFFLFFFADIQDVRIQDILLEIFYGCAYYCVQCFC